ncbi:SDR family oxidoreductase [Mycolicibacterium sp. HK-90]|uniref:SDR family oxidoreductase n=1 Tax=Mycolicibacterium sp. HK-90 TaxID=3056937 RepID=UPI002659C9EB|nr:SDR family oxidoreductase [Mycolicibacterium sp. HK-90]WKG04027.1 SDR family oxidoreductase [Mycolicibacterium sp. HK-90]
MNTSAEGVVLITGASSGLGEEMACQFASRGYELALCARRTDRLDAVAAEIRAATGRRVETAALDVTDAVAVEEVFQDFANHFGVIDRIVVNAGVGQGAALGTGGRQANHRTAMTNFIGALSQTEAALEIFRRQGHGHLVLISSISALRGMRKSMTTYAATKAGIASLAEGLRLENINGVDVSVIYPGYIRSEMNAAMEAKTRFMVDTRVGVKAMVAAIEKRRAKAYVPRWPWMPIAMALKTLPLSIIRNLT